jgi:hypothetical protein
MLALVLQRGSSELLLGYSGLLVRLLRQRMKLAARGEECRSECSLRQSDAVANKVAAGS